MSVNLLSTVSTLFKCFTGLYDLMHDSSTESGRTVNILKRFNVFQEVVLAALYRLFPLKVHMSITYTHTLWS